MKKHQDIKDASEFICSSSFDSGYIEMRQYCKPGSSFKYIIINEIRGTVDEFPAKHEADKSFKANCDGQQMRDFILRGLRHK